MAPTEHTSIPPVLLLDGYGNVLRTPPLPSPGMVAPAKVGVATNAAGELVLVVQIDAAAPVAYVDPVARALHPPPDDLQAAGS